MARRCCQNASDKTAVHSRASRGDRESRKAQPSHPERAVFYGTRSQPRLQNRRQKCYQAKERQRKEEDSADLPGCLHWERGNLHAKSRAPRTRGTRMAAWRRVFTGPCAASELYSQALTLELRSICAHVYVNILLMRATGSGRGRTRKGTAEVLRKSVSTVISMVLTWY